MPEGDTLHRTANRLRPALEGQRLDRFEAPRVTGPIRPTVGTTIVAVEAVGKHLLITFDDGVVLRTHLRMSGSWHLYRVGERWRKGPHLARAVVGTEEWVAVCFSAPVVEAFRAPPPGEPLPPDHPLAHLGPDLCRPDVDLDVAVERFALVAEPDEEIKVALLDQRIAAGIGTSRRNRTATGGGCTGGHRLRCRVCQVRLDGPARGPLGRHALQRARMYRATERRRRHRAAPCMDRPRPARSAIGRLPAQAQRLL
ncbi:MAG TPA: DNA-formamidopyrimidine glycosylase family protein, partial [Acidimicrobiales bacterium]|nr:DNA-formamidopyrimidine glycosylase family protein [Acidimicrobiales bacterium]